MHRRESEIISFIGRGDSDVTPRQLERVLAENEQLRKENALLREALFIDPLTGLGSRRALDAKRTELQQRLHHKALIVSSGDALSEDELHAVVVMSSDVIGLREVNRQGQDAGDKLLQLCAQSLKDFFGTQALLFRRGGDELIGLFPEVTPGATEAREQSIQAFAESAAGSRLRVGHSKALIGSGDLIVAEAMADPKVPLQRRLAYFAAYASRVSNREDETGAIGIPWVQ